ncbi:MAG: hypothetical protein J5556_07105 [Deltaproteobacteria bacterium]|nr:hypothetical protein [Deltaproteobacteria bacterium]
MDPTVAPLPPLGYDAALCPHCGSACAAENTRETAAGWRVRYRRCAACGRKHRTVELYIERADPGRRCAQYVARLFVPDLEDPLGEDLSDG